MVSFRSFSLRAGVTGYFAGPRYFRDFFGSGGITTFSFGMMATIYVRNVRV